MHRLPQGAALYARRVQRHAHGLDVSVWFAIGVERCRCVCYSRSTAHSSLHGCGVCLVLALYLEIRVKNYGAEPIVAVVAERRILVERYPGNPPKQFLVHAGHVFVVLDVLV